MPNGSETAIRGLGWRHLRYGWWSVLVFLTLGAVLETMHGFKIQWYLGAQNETRRLMWTLAHAHGTLLGLIHVGFGVTANAVAHAASARRTALASILVVIASLLIPVGFFLGGLHPYAGDPGLGILLVPLGVPCLFVGIALLAGQVGLARRVASESTGGTARAEPAEPPSPMKHPRSSRK